MYSDVSKIIDTFGDISRGVIAEDAEITDSQAKWPERGIRILQNEGLGGLTIPKEYGGLGQGTKTLAQACEIIGQHCASTSICFGMHCVASAVIASKVTDYQQENYLIPICEGKHLTTLSLSEAGSGSHFYLPETRMQRTSIREHKVHGEKTFATNGGMADSYVVSAVSEDPEQPSGQFNCVMINNDSPGLRWGDPWAGLGMRGNSSRSMNLEGVKILDDDILGNYGDQIWYVFNVITPYFLTAIAGAYLGVARAAIEEVRQHVKARVYSHNGKSLASSSVTQYQLGILWSKYARTRALVYYATECYDRDVSENMVDLFAAKSEVADSVVEIVNDAMTLCGGTAYRDGSKLNRMLRDARASHVMSPTTDMLRVWTGRYLLDQPLLTDT